MCRTEQCAGVGKKAQSTLAETRNPRGAVVVNQNISDTETITICKGRGHPPLYFLTCRRECPVLSWDAGDANLSMTKWVWTIINKYQQQRRDLIPE